MFVAGSFRSRSDPRPSGSGAPSTVRRTEPRPTHWRMLSCSAITSHVVCAGAAIRTVRCTQCMSARGRLAAGRGVNPQRLSEAGDIHRSSNRTTRARAKQSPRRDGRLRRDPAVPTVALEPVIRSGASPALILRRACPAWFRVPCNARIARRRWRSARRCPARRAARLRGVPGLALTRASHAPSGSHGSPGRPRSGARPDRAGSNAARRRGRLAGSRTGLPWRSSRR